MGLFGTSKRETELEKIELQLNDKIQELEVELKQMKQNALQEAQAIELQHKKELLELGVQLEDTLKRLMDESQYVDDLIDTNLINKKFMKMAMKVNRDFSDEANISNLVEMGYGDQSYVENWFNIEEVPNTRESGKDYIISRFTAMVKRSYMLHQEERDHVQVELLWEIVNNKGVSERIDQLAELNDAHSLLASFDSWQEQYRMTLEENNIEYDVYYDEFYLTSSLVSETMYRAMIRRM